MEAARMLVVVVVIEAPQTRRLGRASSSAALSSFVESDARPAPRRPCRSQTMRRFGDGIDYPAWFTVTSHLALFFVGDH
jgi:hypothetical protein